jgi:hypothetical protein
MRRNQNVALTRPIIDILTAVNSIYLERSIKSTTPALLLVNYSIINAAVITTRYGGKRHYPDGRIQGKNNCF